VIALKPTKLEPLNWDAIAVRPRSDGPTEVSFGTVFDVVREQVSQADRQQERARPGKEERQLCPLDPERSRPAPGQQRQPVDEPEEAAAPPIAGDSEVDSADDLVEAVPTQQQQGDNGETSDEVETGGEETAGQGQQVQQGQSEGHQEGASNAIEVMLAMLARQGNGQAVQEQMSESAAAVGPADADNSSQGNAGKSAQPRDLLTEILTRAHQGSQAKVQKNDNGATIPQPASVVPKTDELILSGRVAGASPEPLETAVDEGSDAGDREKAPLTPRQPQTTQQNMQTQEQVRPRQTPPLNIENAVGKTADRGSSESEDTAVVERTATATVELTSDGFQNEPRQRRQPTDLSALADTKAAVGGRSGNVSTVLTAEKGPHLETEPMQENIDRVVRAARAGYARGSARIQIRLEPPELGTVRIDIRHNAGGLVLRVETASPRTQQLLQQHSGELRAALEGQGMNNTQIDIQLRLDLRSDQTAERENGQQSHPQQQDQADRQDSQTQDDRQSGHYQWQSPDDAEVQGHGGPFSALTHNSGMGDPSSDGGIAADGRAESPRQFIGLDLQV